MTTPAAITLNPVRTDDPTALVRRGETGFTVDLARRYAHLFDEFYDHPFLAGLRDGSVEPAAVRHYVGQDHQYLTAYLRCLVIGFELSPELECV